MTGSNHSDPFLFETNTRPLARNFSNIDLSRNHEARKQEMNFIA